MSSQLADERDGADVSLVVGLSKLSTTMLRLPCVNCNNILPDVLCQRRNALKGTAELHRIPTPHNTLFSTHSTAVVCVGLSGRSPTTPSAPLALPAERTPVFRSHDRPRPSPALSPPLSPTRSPHEAHGSEGPREGVEADRQAQGAPQCSCSLLHCFNPFRFSMRSHAKPAGAST